MDKRRGSAMLSSMTTFVGILTALAMLATLGTLFAGMVGMVRGTGPERSNVLMRWRVLLQGVTVLLFVLFLMLVRG